MVLTVGYDHLLMHAAWDGSFEHPQNGFDTKTARSGAASDLKFVRPKVFTDIKTFAQLDSRRIPTLGLKC